MRCPDDFVEGDDEPVGFGAVAVPGADAAAVPVGVLDELNAVLAALLH